MVRKKKVQEQGEGQEKKDRDWDGKAKSIVHAAPQDFVDWLMEGAVHVEKLASEFPSRKAIGDTLLRIKKHGQEAILHIEFQKRRDSKMAERMLAYNILSWLNYGLPVISYVVYLTPIGSCPESPLVLDFDGMGSIHFQFESIKLWEVSTESLLHRGLPGLLPLVPLTRDGLRREVVNEVIERLSGEENEDLLSLAYGFASLAFREESDQEWLRERFRMGTWDILRDTWAFKELREEGREEGRKEGRKEGQLEGQRQAAIGLVQAYFPQLSGLAQERVKWLQKPEDVQQLIIDLGGMREEEHVRQRLLEIKEVKRRKGGRAPRS